MPIFTYFSLVGSVLLGLLFLAEARLGPPTTLSMSTEFHGLPERWKAEEPAVRILTVREAPVADIPATAYAKADPRETAHAKASAQPPLEPAKKIKRAAAPAKKKVAKAPPRARENRFAQSASTSWQREYGAVW